eukprot:6188406-Pleurochrysis_carterae.AAC.3
MVTRTLRTPLWTKASLCIRAHARMHSDTQAACTASHPATLASPRAFHCARAPRLHRAESLTSEAHSFSLFSRSLTCSLTHSDSSAPPLSHTHARLRLSVALVSAGMSLESVNVP